MKRNTGDATLSRRCDSDGLCCELLIKISRVRLRGNLGLKRWDQLLKRSTYRDISVLSNSCPPDDNLQGFLEGITCREASTLSPGVKKYLSRCHYSLDSESSKVLQLHLTQVKKNSNFESIIIFSISFDTDLFPLWKYRAYMETLL